MLVDEIQNILAQLSLWSPVLLLLSVLISIFLVLSKRPEDRKLSLFALASILSVGIGFIGAFVLEPIQSGGWNLQYLFLPFLLCKWMLIGFTICVAVCGGFSTSPDKALRVFCSGFSGVLIALTIAVHTYAPNVERADREFWAKVFENRLTTLERSVYEQHLSRAGREEISGRLNNNKNVPIEVLRLLADVLPDGAYAIADQTTLDRALIDRIVNEAKLVPGGGQFTLERLARNPVVPPDILQGIQGHSDFSVNRSLALNVAAKQDVLLGIVAKSEQVLTTKIAVPTDKRDNWTINNTREILSFAKCNLAKRVDAPGSGITSGSSETAVHINDFVHDDDKEVRKSLASNPYLPNSVLAELTKDSDRDVANQALESVGRSSTTPIEELVQLSKNPAYYHRIQASVASNPNTPVPVLNDLLRVDYETRMAAIRNLAKGGDEASSALRIWLRNTDWFDRRAVANEKRLPKWVYIELIQYPDTQVKQHAWTRLSNLDDISSHELSDLLGKADKQIIEYLAGSTRSSILLLQILAKSPQPEIQQKALNTLKSVQAHGVYDK